MANKLTSCVTGTFLFLSASFGAYAQNTVPTQASNPCGTGVPTQQWEAAFQQFIQQQSAMQAKGQVAVYTIPVIIHVVHGGQAVGTYPNLAQGQLNSQIKVLNDDFGGTGYNSNLYPATAFSAYALAQNIPGANLDPNGRIKIANCNVQFCMATKDTLGNILPEPGIDRINYVSKNWTNPASINSYNAFKSFIDNTVKPQTIWNVSKYLNIWITDENINAVGGLLGYATFPPLTNISGLPANLVGTSTSDGFWCYSRAFGSIQGFPTGTYYSGYDKGRTSTHEIGHWLGLRHIWGDGTCVTDYCNDTPPASSSNSGSPNYPFKTTNCSGNSPNGEMFMNFMDYTNDNGKYMLSTDQATRIQAAMSSSPYRKFLGTHGLCSVSAVAATAAFSMVPSACSGGSVSLLNNPSGTPAPSFTWTANGSAVFNPGPNASSPVISFPTAGTYTVMLSASNGTSASITKTITINPTPTLVLSPSIATVCIDEPLKLTASGGVVYAWQPGSQLGDTAYYTASTSQIYTCAVTGIGNCKTTSTVDITVSECTGLAKIKVSSVDFQIYPNPAIDKLFIRANGVKENNYLVQIMDISGKLVWSQKALLNSQKNELQISTNTLEKGIYLLQLSADGERSQTVKFVKE